ncbi:TetR family transcriptional regulator [Nocardia amikacinitolerans]|uniref:TetR family transcriptional regulator n=1 Tax=Nocardia amikacinitolerans TaxID=756689 RepID=UPI0020A360A4|nr:TetR/AcrR family transcriptional regulator [Nocardia amikacinitolerans]MCP2287547.1 transcriptional regulator, TetR family [Nocardia amikacinitolerans]
MADRRAETTRESRRMLIDAASALFVEKGYQQTTFADVAQRSGISRGSIPWHFGNKEGLLAAVLDQASETLLEASDRADAADSSRAFDLVAQAKRATMARTSLLFVTLYVEAVKPTSPIHDKYVALHERLRQSTTRWIERFARLPETMTADDLATVLVGAAIGIHVQSAMTPDRIDIDRAIDQLGELLKPYVAEADTRD